MEGPTDSRTGARLRELGLRLPEPRGPAGNDVASYPAGDLLFLSGTGPVTPDGGLVTGKVGDGGLDLDTAREAARLTGLQLLGAVQARLGDLDRVRAGWSCSGWSTAVRASPACRR